MVKRGVAVCLALAVMHAPVPVVSQTVPPGAQAVAKVHVKPLGNKALLFEVINFECPADARTAAGKARIAAQWKRELGGEICRGLQSGLTKEVVRVTFCGGRTVITWTATRKSCGLR